MQELHRCIYLSPHRTWIRRKTWCASGVQYGATIAAWGIMAMLATGRPDKADQANLCQDRQRALSIELFEGTYLVRAGRWLLGQFMLVVQAAEASQELVRANAGC